MASRSAGRVRSREELSLFFGVFASFLLLVLFVPLPLLLTRLLLLLLPEPGRDLAAWFMAFAADDAHSDSLRLTWLLLVGTLRGTRPLHALLVISSAFAGRRPLLPLVRVAFRLLAEEFPERLSCELPGVVAESSFH